MEQEGRRNVLRAAAVASASLREIPINLFSVQATDKGNNTPSNRESDPVLTESNSVVTTSSTEPFQVGYRTQV